MEFCANEGKNVTIEAGGKRYDRHAIQTHFVQVGESYLDLMERYVLPHYQEGDILSMSEKVIAMCQGRVVTEDQVKPGFWAKVLSRFVHQTAAGPGMGLPVKMQFADTAAASRTQSNSVRGNKICMRFIGLSFPSRSPTRPVWLPSRSHRDRYRP